MVDWYYVDHLVITVGMISGGSLNNTRQQIGDGNKLDLGEVGGAPPGFDYEFHFLNVPANEVFGIRMVGFYEGNAAHIVKLYEWNFITAGWDAVTNATKDIEDALVDQTYVWMGGGPDYISGGEYRLRMFHPSSGNPGHELHWDIIWLDETYSESEDLLVRFEVGQGSQDLYAHAEIIRQTMFSELPGQLWVRHPYWLWTDRRYLNGVIELDEKLIGNAILEYVIEGVMQDLKCHLIDNNLDYEWDSIVDTPKLIRRATTYGVVAALYARKAQTFTSRVIPVMAPVTVTVIGDDERAMNHWVDKMNNALELYISAQGGLVMDSSTADEEAVFSMADIPTTITEYTSWHEFLLLRGGR